MFLGISFLATHVHGVTVSATRSVVAQVADAVFGNGVLFYTVQLFTTAILIPAITYLMESTSDAIRGRVFALLYMVINGVSALPVLLAAALADNIGTAQVLGGLGVLLLGGGIGVIAGGMHAPAPQPGPTQSAEEQ